MDYFLRGHRLRIALKAYGHCCSLAASAVGKAGRELGNAWHHPAIRHRNPCWSGRSSGCPLGIRFGHRTTEYILLRPANPLSSQGGQLPHAR